MLVNPLDCVVCNAKHDVIGRWGSYNAIACDKVTPTGNTLWFPLKNQVVVGAGLWVSEAPAKELTRGELEAAIASLQNRAAAAEPVSSGPSLSSLKAKLAELQKAI